VGWGEEGSGHGFLDLLSGLAPGDPRPGLGSAAATVLPYASWVLMDAMDINGFPWICMDIHEYPWISINVHACQFDINGFQLMP